jgi:hypothetical protein
MQVKKKKYFIRYLPIYGCISTGLIYVAIGTIAILSFLKLKQGGADESSLMAYLNNFLIGKIFIWIILLGTVSYILWRIFESINDPYNYGKGWLGIGKRTGIAMSSIADALIAFTAIQILSGNGNIQEDGDPDEQRQMVSMMLQESWGEWAVIGIGIIICITAIVQFWYGITKGYKERLDIAHFSSRTKSVIHFLAWVGYFSRGIILGIIGFFFIKGGILETAKYILNTDKAFDFIGDHIGHVYFILVAIGTICYGLFMFAHGLAHDAEKE